MMNLARSITPFLAACSLLLTANRGHAADSVWSTGVGKILPSDDTVFCAYTAYSDNGLFTVAAKLQKRGTDGSLITDNYTDGGVTKLMVKMQCLDVLTGQIGAPISSGTFGDTAIIKCPANGFGVYIRCMLRSTDSNPFVYGGGSNSGGDPCGNGVKEITLASGNGYKGQVTGYVSELNFAASAGHKLFNQSVMTTAQVHGTDLGYMFYSGGSLWSGYGDTWANDQLFPVAPTNLRGSILFSTQDLDPSDNNGLSFSSWIGNGNPNFAKEVVPSCHNTPLGCNEVTAIATAGVGLSEGGTRYRVLWFDSIAGWVPFTSNVATLAWSVNGGAFSRADKTAPPGGTIAPQWSNTSHFGAGAIVHDRMGGWLYFFGQRPYQPNTPIRLARVPAKFASVMDRTKYEYWSGSDWVKNSQNPLAPSDGTYFGPIASSAANIIPASINAAPEFSVAFDAYANRYLMLLVTNRWTNAAAVELWQSSYITGPWTKVTNGASRLPRAGTTGGTYFPYNFFYGPYMSEHIMRGGGQSIYYQLSEWNGFPFPIAFGPYNTGLWTFNVTREPTAFCTP